MIVASACGVVTGIGGLFTWIGARGPRPTVGIDHTSFSKMLVYTLVDGSPFVKSVGFVTVVLGLLMVIGAISGLRILAVLGGVLASSCSWRNVDRVDRTPLQHTTAPELLLPESSSSSLGRFARRGVADHLRSSPWASQYNRPARLAPGLGQYNPTFESSRERRAQSGTPLRDGDFCSSRPGLTRVSPMYLLETVSPSRR